MSLADARSLATAFLATRPDCAPFLPTLQGVANPIPGEAGLKRGPAGAVAALMPELAPHASTETQPLVETVIAARDKIDWWNAYAPSEPGGRGFATRSAACLLSGPGGPFTSTHGRAGFFYVRKGVEYAPHKHRPREIYALISGGGWFWNETTGWQRARVGEIVRTPEESWHAMATPDMPVLILWCWIGEDFEGRPIFRNQQGTLPA